MADNVGYIAEDDGELRHRTQNNNKIDVRVIDPVERNVTPPAEGASTDRTPRAKRLDLLYSINDTPPWYLCILLGLQHYLTAFGAILSIPLILAPAFCLQSDDVGTAEILSTLIFVSGFVTVLQSTFGTRLPIVQGGSFSYIIPTFAILNLPRWKCPEFPDYTNTTLFNDTMREQLEDYKQEVWHARIREIQGAIMLSSLFQVVIGATGILGFLLNFIGPLAIAPTIALVGLSLFEAAAATCEGLWWISVGTIICITVFSQLLHKLDIPCCKVTNTSTERSQCVRAPGFPLFRLFPMLLAICLMWLICYILTITDALPSDPNKWGYLARTDSRIEVLQKARWFRFPYPFQWGMPTFSLAGVFGMVAGVIAGMIESLGDYYACARLSGAPPPPIPAINRGVLVEGIGCVLSGMWGTGSGTTSYSENIGAIGITKVGSRVVIQTAGLLMLCLGMFGKFGALFVTIPPPIIGGVFMVTFGMISAVGVSNLQYVDMNSSRNLFIVGFSLFFGLSLPQWMKSNPQAIHTGVSELDQILTVLLSTSMFVGGTVGFLLDNIIPGTIEERGIKGWRKDLDEDQAAGSDQKMNCYNLPWCGARLNRVKFFSYLPFCPTFSCSPSCRCCPKTQRRDSETATINAEKDMSHMMTPPVVIADYNTKL